MAITALPTSTVRLLGSSVAITSTPDLVKELIDNAIDAEATSIEVTVSADTVKKVQVRDNGQGIAFEDLDLLGRRSHTSKLRSFDELRTKGGQTLGFRGEALASANCLATLVITTRTAGDPVASRLQLNSGVDGVQEKKPVSAPTGTTVLATKLFEALPVRKQHALKEAHRSISRIKVLLQAYALARPCLKLSFKIPERSQQSWSYSPSQKASVRDAVLQLLGKDAAANCVHMTLRTRDGKEKLAGGHAAYTLDGFFPAPGCKPAAIKGQGAFISVDSRPITSSRGIAKKLAACLKTHLTRALDLRDSHESLTSPFMQLNIQCSLPNYDSNVATLKDEVLFADESNVLENFSHLCEKLYLREDATTASEDERIIQQRADLPTQNQDENAPSTIDPLPQEKAGSALAEDFLSDDLEFLNARESIADPNAISVGGRQSQPQPPKHGSLTGELVSLGVQEEPGAATFTAKMRTVSKVDLARKGSDVTDENSAVETVEVRIPFRPRLSKVQQKEASIRTTQPKASRQFEDIHRYFKPSRERDIQIATDETATIGESEYPDTTNCGQGHSGRQPLQPIDESSLNIIANEPESASDSSDVETETLQPHHAPMGALDVPLARRGRSVMNERELERESPPGGRAPRDIPLPSAGTPEMAHSSGRLNENLAMQTPPSSDPFHRERPPNPAFRAPRRNVPARAQRLPVSRIGQTDSVIDNDGLRQTTISLQGRENEDYGQERQHLSQLASMLSDRQEPLPSHRVMASNRVPVSVQGDG